MYLVSKRFLLAGKTPTFIPGIHDLHCVDDLRVKPRGDLNAHARGEEDEV